MHKKSMLIAAVIINNEPAEGEETHDKTLFICDRRPGECKRADCGKCFLTHSVEHARRFDIFDDRLRLIASDSGAPASVEKPAIKTVYIAGAISNDPEYREKFDVAELAIARAGYLPVNPAALPSEGFTYEQYMKITEEMLKCCDAVFFLPDWVSSKGARYEMGCALAHKKQILIGDVEQAVNYYKNARPAVLTDEKFLIAEWQDVL